MMAKAPVWESFRISSFFSRLWWEPRASEVSQKPSRWMAPLAAMGSTRAPAARRKVPRPSRRQSWSHAPSSRAMKRPTTGKKHMAQERLFWSQSTLGAGSREYMASAIHRERSIGLTPPSSRRECRRPPHRPGPPGGHRPVEPGQAVQVVGRLPVVGHAVREELIGDHHRAGDLPGELFHPGEHPVKGPLPALGAKPLVGREVGKVLQQGHRPGRRSQLPQAAGPLLGAEALPRPHGPVALHPAAALRIPDLHGGHVEARPSGAAVTRSSAYLDFPLAEPPDTSTSMGPSPFLLSRACLKIGDVSSGEEFWPPASNFFAGILSDFKEKLRRPGAKRPADWTC